MASVRLTCPKCGRSFDYDYIPGASMSAVRLGTSRYFACPLCGKRSVFNLRQPRKDPPPDAGQGPQYSDTRHFLRWIPAIAIPFAAALISLLWITTYPMVVLAFVTVCLVLIAIVGIVLFARTRPPLRMPPS